MSKQIPAWKRGKHRGRRADATFLRLPHYLITSPEWRALSGNAVKFLIDLAAEYNGRNNGDLALTRRKAMEQGWRSGGTRDRAAEEAVEAGFALVTRNGYKGTCTLYAITWEPINDVGKGVMFEPEHKASHRWKRQIPWPQNGPQQAPPQGQAA